jgi:hypothetical protein
MKAFVLAALPVALTWFTLELMPQLKAELVRYLKGKVRSYLKAKRERNSSATPRE